MKLESTGDDSSLWDTDDVARFFKVSRSWVYQRVASGKLDCVRIGGNVRFVPSAIRSLVTGEPAGSSKVISLQGRAPANSKK